MSDINCNRCVEPYLFFNGRCEEALAFYQSAIGAQVDMMMRFNESPEPCASLPAGFENKVMHSSFRIGSSVIMASDGDGSGVPNYDGFSLSIGVKDEAGADRLFNALAADGVVKLPLSKTFWSPRFGMLTDRFGINWMVGVVADYQK